MSQQLFVERELFVDREEEMAFLMSRYQTPVPECIILYGRRRVGKTTLSARFLDEVPGFYFLASEEGTKSNIRDFSHYAGEYLKDPDFERSTYPDWPAVMKALVGHRNFYSSHTPANAPTNTPANTSANPPENIPANPSANGGKVVIIIDEFPYLIARDRATPSVFQKVWDQVLSREQVMFVISGSSVSAMEHDVLGYTSPLYGRRTGQWQLEPIPYPYLREFLPYDEEDLVQTWCILGGIPAYLRMFRADLSLWDNVAEQILRKGAYLYSEAELLMQYEFREAGNYMAILRALVEGHTALSPLCQRTGLDKSMVSKYLSILSRMHIIMDEVPVTAHAGYRRRHYRLTDPYLAFWFRFVYPRRTELETGKREEVLASIREEIPPYCGQMFERITEDLITRGILFEECSVSRIGRWWHKDVEIDIVGFDETRDIALFCECKWSSLTRRQARGVLGALQEKAGAVRWRNDDRTEQFALVAKRVEGKDELRREGYLVCDLEDIRVASEMYLTEMGRMG